jgi:hypothetical protein
MWIKKCQLNRDQISPGNWACAIQLIYLGCDWHDVIQQEWGGGGGSYTDRLAQRKVNSSHLCTYRYFVSCSLSDTLNAWQLDWPQLAVFVSRQNETGRALPSIQILWWLHKEEFEWLRHNKLVSDSRKKATCSWMRGVAHAFRLWWWSEVTQISYVFCAIPICFDTRVY